MSSMEISLLQTRSNSHKICHNFISPLDAQIQMHRFVLWLQFTHDLHNNFNNQATIVIKRMSPR